jgi:hypothetical protein
LREVIPELTLLECPLTDVLVDDGSDLVTEDLGDHVSSQSENLCISFNRLDCHLTHLVLVEKSLLAK